MNKTKHSDLREKRLYQKENGFAIICIFAICYHTDKKSKQTI